jgi:hypothetical protein
VGSGFSRIRAVGFSRIRAVGFSRIRAVGFSRICLAALLLLAAAPAFAQESYVVVVTGVAGDDAHAKQFHAWASKLVDAAKTRDGVADANITYLGDKPDMDAKLIRGRSTSENVQKAIADIAAKAKPGDQVVIVLIGHGSFDGNTAAFSMPGPDMTVADWVAQLKKLSAQKVAFINTTASSGAFLPTVAAPGRTVVTATKTGG